MSNIVIGIEGLVGSGKTSMCRELLNEIPNSIVFHGGNLYRGIIYAVMNSNKELGSNMQNLKQMMQDVDIKNIMDKLKVEFKVENRETVVYVDGKKIDEEKLQSKQASMAVSVAGGSADNTKLFSFCKNIINEFKEKYNVILSGRALMSIYPELDYHFFITASLDERVKRKASQYGENANIEELKEHIMLRDELQKKAGFYDLNEKTIQVDVTDCKSVKESTYKLLEYINRETILA